MKLDALILVAALVLYLVLVLALERCAFGDPHC